MRERDRCQASQEADRAHMSAIGGEVSDYPRPIWPRRTPPGWGSIGIDSARLHLDSKRCLTPGSTSLPPEYSRARGRRRRQAHGAVPSPPHGQERDVVRRAARGTRGEGLAAPRRTRGHPRPGRAVARDRALHARARRRHERIPRSVRARPVDRPIRPGARRLPAPSPGDRHPGRGARALRAAGRGPPRPCDRARDRPRMWRHGRLTRRAPAASPVELRRLGLAQHRATVLARLRDRHGPRAAARPACRRHSTPACSASAESARGRSA